jgi:hypothetical protein
MPKSSSELAQRLVDNLNRRVLKHAADNSMTNLNSTLPRLGVDPIIESMIRSGVPLTRDNYVARLGLEGPLEGEHAAMVDEAMKVVEILNDPDPNRPEIEADGIRIQMQRLQRANRGPQGGLL